MVYYSEHAENDLYNILVGLANWNKHPLELEHALSYYDDIRDVCAMLENSTYHVKTTYLDHRKYGEFVYKYTRNKTTVWYIVYDFNQSKNIIYIQHITSNHTTKV